MGGMLRRWLIRVPFLLALACVLSVWVVSYFGALAAYTDSHGDRKYISAVQGLWDMGEVGSPGYAPGSHFQFYGGWNSKDWNLPPTTLGFYYGRPLPVYRGFEIVFPLWLPALVLAGLNWFVWRKTRGKGVGGVGRAFPVEAASEGPPPSASSP